MKLKKPLLTCIFVSGIIAFQALAALREFPVSIVMLDTDPEGSIDQIRAKLFIETLNDKFIDKSGKKVFAFKLSSFLKLDNFPNSSCLPLKNLGHQYSKPLKKHVEKAFNDCNNSAIVDKTAINVFIFRSVWNEGELRKSSRIYFNNFRPFVFMNYDRLDNDWAVWQHEFGHVFGLPEFLVCDVAPDSPSNIMAKEKNSCSGAGGPRELGFENWQVRIMKSIAPLISARLN